VTALQGQQQQQWWMQRLLHKLPLPLHLLQHLQM
jgi:hypothetical protein